jgi:hypothetical protein
MLWKLRVAGHPVKGVDGDHSFDTLVDLERYVGKHDVQKDMIKKVSKIEYGSETIYGVADMLSVSAIRLVLTVTKTKYYLETDPPGKSW